MHDDAVPSEVYISSLAVAPEARGLGVGTRLLDSIEDFATQTGRSKLRLHVIDENIDARRLYERCGFKVTESTSIGPILSWLLGFKRVHMMEKTLSLDNLPKK